MIALILTFITQLNSITIPEAQVEVVEAEIEAVLFRPDTRDPSWRFLSMR